MAAALVETVAGTIHLAQDSKVPPSVQTHAM